MKFELIEDFRKHADELVAILKGVHSRRESALEEVQALKAEYERVIRESLLTGRDTSSELDELCARIATAEELFKRRDLEYQLFVPSQAKKISREDVVSSWNSDFFPKYKRELFDPAIESLLKAKLSYIDAYLHYKKVVSDYDTAKNDVLRTLAPSGEDGKYRYAMKNIDFDALERTNTYFLNRGDLHDLSSSQVPVSVRHVKRGKRGE